MTSRLRDALVKARDYVEPIAKRYGIVPDAAAFRNAPSVLNEIDAALSTPTEEVTDTRASILEEAAKVAEMEASRLEQFAMMNGVPSAHPNPELAYLHEQGALLAQSIAAAIRSLAKGEG